MNDKNETDIIGSIDLDKILTMVWDFLSDVPEKPRFNFMKLHDDEIMTQIKEYSMDVNGKNFSGMDRQNVEEFIEQDCVKLFDTITQANFDFFKQGARLGARLVAELCVKTGP